MMRVLITGADSYIGSHLQAWLCNQGMESVEICVKTPVDPSVFAGIDSVVHVAGIAHRKETSKDEAQYHAVNAVLPVTIAQMAKAQGVKQFVFLSSMSVYGITVGHITKDTLPAPSTFYGKSKWAAEQSLEALASATFSVAILRPPMIYGARCKGNYPRLSSLVLKTPFFPAVKNERSMLYIDTLCAFLQALIQSGQGGLYFPQNVTYVSTNALVTAIAKAHHKKLFLTPGFGALLCFLQNRVSLIGKVFGTLTYDQALSTAFRPIAECSFDQSIARSEGNP